jgi:hypothetical protein
MFDLHPDDATERIELRQQIVQQGVMASRHPGDLAGIRDLIGRLFISTGERIRGCQRQAAESGTPPVPSRLMQLAR